MQISKTIGIFGSLLKTILIRIIGYTLIGILINVVLLTVQWDVISSIFTSTSDKDNNLIISYLSLISVILFPVLFFIVGQKQGVMKALSNLISKKRTPVISWLLNQFHKKYPKILEAKNESNEKIIATVNNVAGYVDNVPILLTPVLNSFASIIDLGAKYIVVAKTAKCGDLSSEEKIEDIAKVISDMIPEDLLSPGLKLPLILLTFNLAVFFL